MATMPSVQTVTSSNSASARQLVVGREIVVSGDIKSCESLVVEGTVRANVECQDLRIEASGLFAGSATVTDAEIYGRFEGDLTVTGRLRVRANGEVTAKVRYHGLEIERGGKISGDLQAQPAPKRPQAAGVTALRS